MDFYSYLKQNNVVDLVILNKLRDQAAMIRGTVFRGLYLLTGTEEEILSYQQLAELFEQVAVANGEHVTRVETTMGFSIDMEVYRNLGGVSTALAERILPLIKDDTKEYIALTNRPDDDSAMERLHRAYGNKVYSYGIAPRVIWGAIYNTFVQPLLVATYARQLSDSVGTANSSGDTAKDSEARRLCQMIINAGVATRASDARFIPTTDTCVVQFRVDGHNQVYTTVPRDILEKICNILKTDGKMTSSKPFDPVDGKVRYSPSNGTKKNDEIDLRISIIPSKKGSDLNIRYLSDKIYSFEELGMTPEHIKNYQYLLNMPSGMIVQVGPTGSGKSTTLYAGINYMKQSMRNIITVEDPVEITMDGISQIDVDNDKRLSFSDALKACLRHDPDVIVVGELRDETTAALAVRAANTGHLVLTSLHTNDAIGAFERMINLGVDPYSLGEVMVAVMGQRLVRRLCPKCKQEYRVSLKSDIARFYKLPNQDGDIRFWKPMGCIHCNNTGYRGRVAVNEILMVTPKIRNLIQRHAVRKEFEDCLREEKFRTMYSDGLSKAIAGITSLEELAPMAQDIVAFKG